MCNSINLLKVVLVILAISGKSVRPSSSQTTVRPYKFGFNIEEQQHRFEKRDERGIVMGEFGFITADGIYHVTVYATDEDGKFRILAMKNYPYKPLEVSSKAPPTTTSAPLVHPKDVVKKFYNADACSGCIVPNGKASLTGRAGGAKIDIRTLAKTVDDSFGVIGEPASSPNALGSGAKGPSQAGISSNQNSKPLGTVAAGPGPAGVAPNQNNKPKGVLPDVINAVVPLVGTSINNKNTDSVQGRLGASAGSNKGSAPSSGLAGSQQNNPKQQQGSGKFSNPSAGIKTGSSAVGSDADLYRFKYILDYNGHSEKGSRNGNKEGSYFVIGDDNIERTIEYIANEFGYQPHIKVRKLDANAPRPDQNSLKEYEFVWFSDDKKQ